ncbi:hypothetical protein [Haliangium ochraceum]|nr:hypothetical protein [Haliangium ochraceum]
MTEAEAGDLAGSLDNLSTNGNVSTDPGAAPEIAMQGEAESTASQDRAALDQQVSGAEQQAASDIQQPMGEDSIETTVPTEELSAAPIESAAASEIALPDAVGAAAAAGGGEELGIIAQEQSQAEIDAAIATAQAGIASERGKHAEAEAQARSDADQQMAELQTQADADSEAARQQAQGEVDQARGEWRAEVEGKSQEARAKADAKVNEGLAEVESKHTQANADAQKHIADGQKKAQSEKEKGEKEAQAAKDKGKEKSSGFFGWLASKAKKFFDGIKKAVSQAIEAAKAAVKKVIDAAKKLATEVIELARKAIVSAIQAIGKALIAISDALLAAFPELRERFRNAIQGFVDKAVETVNEIAEGLKEAVQKALDALGGALDALLGLLEKGLHAVVDACAAVVDGAIAAAQAVVETLGQWAELIKHIAKAPGAWIGKLGAAAMDGIRNHLWGAFKSAAIAWFTSKVMEMLGIGGIILQLLLDGGLTTENITQMALDALLTAIPAALIAVLIEKVISMIIPAAGAVLAVIEGLQAAWGAVSRIIAAFSAFMAFLLAVESGSAGPLFATALAAGAIVVLDFVSNWLLRKLMSAARKVGRKLKGLAQKFKNRRKGRRDRDRDGRPRRGDDDHGEDDDSLADLRAEAKRAAQRGWNAARRRSEHRVVRANELEQALRSSEGRRGGTRIELELVQSGDRWEVRATAHQGGRRATADAGTGWIARDGNQAWYTASDQSARHRRVADEAERRLEQDARELAPNSPTLRELHAALRPRIQQIERTLTERLIEGIRFDINESAYQEGKDRHGDDALLYSWEIRPNTSKKKLAASGGKKRGDHLFNHGLTKLQRKLGEQLTGALLEESVPLVNAALASLGSSFAHPAFKVTVQKPASEAAGGDVNSQTFGRASQALVAGFQNFLSALEEVEFANDDERAAKLAALEGSLGALTSQWHSLLDSAYDSECSAYLAREDKALEQQGLGVLASARAQFPQSLQAILIQLRGLP